MRWTPSNHIKHHLSTVASAKVFGSPTEASLETNVEKPCFLHEARDGCRCLWVQICTETGSEASTCLGCSWSVATSKSDTRHFTLNPFLFLQHWIPPTTLCLWSPAYPCPLSAEPECDFIPGQGRDTSRTHRSFDLWGFLRRRPCDCCVPNWTGYNAGRTQMCPQRGAGRFRLIPTYRLVMSMISHTRRLPKLENVNLHGWLQMCLETLEHPVFFQLTTTKMTDLKHFSNLRLADLGHRGLPQSESAPWLHGHGGGAVTCVGWALSHRALRPPHRQSLADPVDDLTSVPYVTRQQVVLDGKVYTVYALRAMMGPGFPPHTSYNCFPHNPIVTHGCESNRFGIEQVLVTSRDHFIQYPVQYPIEQKGPHRQYPPRSNSIVQYPCVQYPIEQTNARCARWTGVVTHAHI